MARLARQSGSALGTSTPRTTLGMLCAAAALACLLPLPWGLGALLFLVPGFVLGFRGFMTPPAGRWQRSFFAVTLLVLTALSMLVSVRVAFYSQQARLERCYAGAITEAGRSECAAEVRVKLAGR